MKDKHLLHVHFLGGFLMGPQEWLRVFTKPQPQHVTHIYHDVLRWLPQNHHAPEQTWAHWCQGFSNQVLSTSAQTKNILVGYSLGGRLALHHLLHTCSQPLWDAVVCISTHPGLTQDKQKAERLRHDALWAEQLLHEPWNVFWTKWKAQGVFKDTDIERPEPSDTQKKEWAFVLDGLSLGRQLDMRPFLKTQTTPLLWLTGKQDEKFYTLAQELAHHPCISLHEITNSAHRVPWDNSREFCHMLDVFFKKI